MRLKDLKAKLKWLEEDIGKAEKLVEKAKTLDKEVGSSEEAINDQR